MQRLLLLALVPFLLGARSAADVRVDIEGVRGEKGVVHVCLTRERAYFPDCGDDPHALKQTVVASRGQVQFRGVATGNYAVTLFHDANRNGKLDMFLGIPREGFGFSRNPVVRTGPPKFDSVVVMLGSGQSRLPVRMQYIL